MSGSIQGHPPSPGKPRNRICEHYARQAPQHNFGALWQSNFRVGGGQCWHVRTHNANVQKPKLGQVGEATSACANSPYRGADTLSEPSRAIPVLQVTALLVGSQTSGNVDL